MILFVSLASAGELTVNVDTEAGREALVWSDAAPCEVLSSSQEHDGRLTEVEAEVLPREDGTVEIVVEVVQRTLGTDERDALHLRPHFAVAQGEVATLEVTRSRRTTTLEAQARGFEGTCQPQSGRTVRRSKRTRSARR